MFKDGNVSLMELIYEMPVVVTFTKKSGEVRSMICTMCKDYLPELEAEKAGTKPVNPEVATVWDLENDGWRSFRWDTVQGITFGDIPEYNI